MTEAFEFTQNFKRTGRNERRANSLKTQAEALKQPFVIVTPLIKMVLEFIADSFQHSLKRGVEPRQLVGTRFQMAGRALPHPFRRLACGVSRYSAIHLQFL